VPRLSEADFRGVLEVLHAAGDVEGTIPFPERVLGALLRLVPCDVVAYHERIGSHDIVVWVGEPRAPATPEIRLASKRHPPLEDVLAPADGARRYSDLMTAKQFHRTALYQEVARPLGIEDMMRLWLDPRGVGNARLEFDRPDRRFRSSDRAVLDLLLPHLRQFRRNAVARRSPSWPASGVGGLSPREHEVLGLVAQGLTNNQVARMLWISPGTVRKHLENVYEKLGVHTRTGAIAAVFALEPRAGRTTELDAASMCT